MKRTLLATFVALISFGGSAEEISLLCKDESHPNNKNLETILTLDIEKKKIFEGKGIYGYKDIVKAYPQTSVSINKTEVMFRFKTFFSAIWQVHKLDRRTLRYTYIQEIPNEDDYYMYFRCEIIENKI